MVAAAAPPHLMSALAGQLKALGCNNHPGRDTMTIVRAIALVGVWIALATACRSGRPPTTDQIAAFHRLLRMEAVAPTDTLCVGLIKGDATRDAPPAVLAALRTEVPGVRTLSECAGDPARKRLYLTSVQRTADTLIFTGAAGAITYRCRVSYSGAWPGTCAASRGV
jgi:hypothetical protein